MIKLRTQMDGRLLTQEESIIDYYIKLAFVYVIAVTLGQFILSLV